MIDNIDYLFALLNTYVAFIAFATIVATLRQSFGTPLTQFQYILFRFFVESGLLHVILLLVPIMLFNLYADNPKIWWWSTLCVVVVPLGYVPSYLYRRSQVKNKVTPWSSKAVTIGYLMFTIFNLALIAGLTPWQPSLLTLSAYFLWSMVAVILIFLTFLGTFIHFEDDVATEERLKNGKPEKEEA
ncbi:MAG: hypothetical protein HKN36_05045 [Hellea sp.]|nr:hypothetical protein [Hellea sp.]